MTVRDEAWTALLDALDIRIDRKVSNEITAQDIKDVTGREPRIVCSMDSHDKLAAPLQDRGMFVLPVRNGVYRLVQGLGYHDLEAPSGDVEEHHSTIPFEFVTTTGAAEDRYLQYAYNTGLLSEFTGYDDIYQTSVGRKFSNAFRFRVGDSRPLDVEGVQFQVDGLFEGHEAVLIVEAKADQRESFIVRQLYYPYRHYDGDADKDIRTFFFLHDDDNDRYKFWEYVFRDPEDYASIQLRQAKEYVVRRREPDLQEFNVDKDDELREAGWEWRVPQADTVAKIEEFPFLVRNGIDDAEQVAAYFDFTQRQSSYYRQAAEILGLIETDNHHYKLTSTGEEFVGLRPDRRNEMMAKQMLQVPVMNEVLQQLIQRLGQGGGYLHKDDIASLIDEHTDLSGATLGRRAQSVLAWFTWISERVGLVEVDGRRVRLALG